MENSNTPIIVKSGGMGAAGTVITLALLTAGGFAAYKLIKQGKENSAEGKLDTEAGQIASELKVVFDSWPIDKAAYLRIALRINSANKDDVYKIYRKLTGRNLSDDETKLPSGVKERATKVEQYNSKPGRLFSIDANNNIKFEIAAGSLIRFMPGQTTPVTAYNSAFGIILNEINNAELLKKLKSDPKTAALTVSISVKPSAKLYKVVQTKEIPYESLQQAEGFFKYVRPFVKTRKVFAAVQILAGYHPTTKKPVYLWIDARDMVTYKPQMKGLGSLALIA